MFSRRVPPKIAGAFAREVAVTTLERPFSSVLALVFPYMSRWSAGIVAFITLERPFSRMCPAESQKPRQRVSNADRKVFANPESFCDKFIIG